MCIFCERFKGGGRDPLMQDMAPVVSLPEAREAEQCPTLRTRQRPATIVTGFLGSGKTTFLNYLLQTPHVPKGLAVLINEFGDVSIDDHLLAARATALDEAPTLIPMPNGCLCCKVRGDLLQALITLAGTEAVRHVIIEGSGLAPTLPVAQTFLDPRVQPDLRLTHIINVVDASRFADQLADEGSYGKLVREQMALSSVTLLNKVDLVPPPQRERFVATLAALGSLVVPCRNGRVNVAQVLREQDWVDRLAKGGPVTHLHGVWSLSVEGGPAEGDAVLAWLAATVEALGDRLMRCKGLLARREGPARVVQGVGQHLEVTEGTAAAPRSMMVFLGVGPRPADLQPSFSASLQGQAGV